MSPSLWVTCVTNNLVNTDTHLYNVSLCMVPLHYCDFRAAAPMGSPPLFC
jgi:hypothetical protein